MKNKVVYGKNENGPLIPFIIDYKALMTMFNIY